MGMRGEVGEYRCSREGKVSEVDEEEIGELRGSDG